MPTKAVITEAPINLTAWYEENKEQFSPPFCNKVMYKKQLIVMFVGGPNQRRDFHLDRGSEFFYQMRGGMRLPTLQQGKLKIVDIPEGHVFLLPSCVPHSPQRPDKNSLGLVMERERYFDELDGLRYYCGFSAENIDEPESNADDILWERFFFLENLEKDVLPVVKAFNESDECKTNKPGDNVLADPPLQINDKVSVPDPFPLQDFLDKNANALAKNEGAPLPLFGEDHPDKEFRVLVVGPGKSRPATKFGYETFLFQIRGCARVFLEGKEDTPIEMKEEDCFIVQPNVSYRVERDEESIGMVVTQTPRANEEFYGLKM